MEDWDKEAADVAYRCYAERMQREVAEAEVLLAQELAAEEAEAAARAEAGWGGGAPGPSDSPDMMMLGEGEGGHMRALNGAAQGPRNKKMFTRKVRGGLLAR